MITSFIKVSRSIAESAIERARALGAETVASFYRAGRAGILTHQQTLDAPPDHDAAGFAGPGQTAADDRAAAHARNLELALSNMSQGLCLFDSEERIVFANRRVCVLLGLTEADTAPGTPFSALIRSVLGKHVPPEKLDETCRVVYARQRELTRRPEGGTTITNGRNVPLAIVHRPLTDGSWVTTYEDITERHRSEATIAHMSRHDSLTEMPNRDYFAAQLGETIAKAAPDERIAVLSIDLERFRDINDSHGYAIGDQVLQVLSQRMLASVEPGTFIARSGGDEFVGFKTISDDNELLQLVNQVDAWFKSAVTLTELSFKIEASIGIAVYPRDGLGLDKLLNNAGLARERARVNLNVTPCLYEASMDEAARTRRSIAGDLGGALQKQEFHLVYQVQKSLMDGGTIGFEALIRWNHPTRGAIPPADFIPVAEESGMIVEIGDWVLRTACAEAATWQKPLTIAVNLSAIQLRDSGLAGRIHQILLDTGLAPGRLELEITETSIITDKRRAQHVLRQIKALGVRIAIDDFGTGYASLDMLSSFAFDKIKIDRSFLMEAESSPQAKTIIRTIVVLGRSLNVPVLAEGVETAWHMALLRAEGCAEAQGYWLGRPRREVDIDEQPILAAVG